MPNKIPVGATIAQSYRFAFGNFLNNLGACWMPLSLMFIGFYFLIPPYIQLLSHFAAMAGKDPAAQAVAMQENVVLMGTIMPIMMLAGIVIYVCLISATVGVTKEALGLRTGSAFFQFPFDKAVWRTLATMLLLIAILMAAEFAAIIIGAIAALAGTFLLTNVSVALKGGLGFLLGAIFFCAYAYGLIRLVFLLIPTVVAEGKISVKRSWDLAGGNFWRIIVLFLSLIIPVLIVEWVCVLAILGPELFLPLSAAATPQEVGDHFRQIFDNTGARLQSLWYVYLPLGFLVYVFILSLGSGMNAFAYRALTAQES